MHKKQNIITSKSNQSIITSKELIESNKSNKMKILYENNFSGEKKLKVDHTVLLCNIKGNNARIYPKEIMMREAKKFMSKIGTGRMGELNHPRLDNEGNPRDYPLCEINLAKAAHFIEKLYFVGDEMHMKSRIIESIPCGKILGSILREGIEVGTSIRGYGSTEMSYDGEVVCDDYKFVTVDFVGNPSYGKEAMVSGMFECICENKKTIPYLTECVQMEIEDFKNTVEKEARNHNIGSKESYHKANALINSLMKY